MLMQSKPGPPWRDTRWTMPQKEKPGLGQGLGQGRDRSWTVPSSEKPGLGQGLGQGEILSPRVAWARRVRTVP